MKAWIKSFYIKPNHQLFHFFENVNKHWWKISLFVFVAVVSFPAYLLFKQIQMEKQHQQTILDLNQDIHQKERLIATLIEKQKAMNEKDNNLTKISQQIQHILEKYEAKGDIQWNTETGKNVSLVTKHRTMPMFKIIEELNQLKNLGYQEIILTKLNEKRLIQLNATLQFIPNQGE